jgi:hypothetical protein
MLKSLTLSFSLAVALGMCSASMAGVFDHCSTCGLASPQGSVVPSAQGVATSCDTCAPKHKLFSGMGGHFSSLKGKLHSAMNPPVTYEWVLKKKHNWFHKGAGCSTCGTAAPVYATTQVAPAAQSAPTYGTSQHAFAPYKPAATIASVPSDMTPATPAGDDAPPAPEIKETSARGLLLPTPAGN